MASSHSQKRKRIDIDAPFAAIPQALVLDTNVSAAACRLWGVLFVFHWNDMPPDFDKLAEALATTERSVYRWLQELESACWIGWHRNKGVPDRFTLHMRVEASKNDTPVNSGDEKLTPVSKQLIPRSKQLTPVSEELTQVSISTLLDGAPMPQIDRLSSDQNHEKIQKNSNSSDARTILRDCGLYNGAIRQVLALGIDEPTLIASAQNLAAAGWGGGAIADELRDHPPPKGQPYARPEQSTRSVQFDHAPDRPRRSVNTAKRDPERDAEFAAQLAEFEQLAAERNGDMPPL